MSDSKIETARRLLRQGRFDDARRLVNQIDHPNKAQWLAQIARLEQKARQSARPTCPKCGSPDLAQGSVRKGLKRVPALQCRNCGHVWEKAAASTAQSQATSAPTSSTKPRRGALPAEARSASEVDFKRVLDVLNSDAPCIFVTGWAGTGKSTLLRRFMQNTRKRAVVLAPTAAGALSAGGQTIHSFFRFRPGILDESDIKPSAERGLYEAVNAIVIDDVSMVRADLIDRIDQFMRLNGREEARPFGGAQLILFGDLYQLPPAVTDEERVRLEMQGYRSEYFFDAHIFDFVPLRVETLETPVRQRDPAFIDLLSAVRTGELTGAQLQTLNTTVDTNFLPSAAAPHVILTATSRRAAEINRLALAQLQTIEFTYTGETKGQFPQDSLPTDQTLMLKVGAQVMFVRDDAERRWTEGTPGRVARLTKDTVQVEIASDGQKTVVNVPRETWEAVRYHVDGRRRKIQTEVVGTYTQFPVKLVWAIPVHRSQGLTLDRVMIDLSAGAFAQGQVYVALSRARALDGLILPKPLNASDIKVDPLIQRFMAQATKKD